MKKSLIRSSIIVLIQAILPIIALLLITPWLVSQATSLNEWPRFLKHNQYVFLIFHLLFYFLLIALWPKLVSAIQSNETNRQQLQLAMQARWYLLAVFLFIELIMFI